MLISRNNNSHVKFISYDGNIHVYAMVHLFLKLMELNIVLGIKQNILNFGQVAVLVVLQVIGTQR